MVQPMNPPGAQMMPVGGQPGQLQMGPGMHPNQHLSNQTPGMPLQMPPIMSQQQQQQQGMPRMGVPQGMGNTMPSGLNAQQEAAVRNRMVS